MKRNLIEKRFKNLNTWVKTSSLLFSGNNHPFNNSVASISLLGFHEALQFHCGIEFERLETSENFLWRILNNVKIKIEEYNMENNSKFMLSQPHTLNSLNNPYIKNKYLENYNLQSYRTRVINPSSHLSLEKAINLFKKFETKFTGGILFNYDSKRNIEEFSKDFKKLFECNLKGFSINNPITN
ncbi:MAG: hypothetical protein EU550_02490 [Promethearchaeota archaeon]|nr:MAG: hypothetical protein EU550_02490 [Candidatus Lokiarchaeota archaeon]